MNAVELISHAEDILAKTADYESIANIYEDWLEHNGNLENSAPIWFNLGVAYSNLNQKDKLESCYLKAKALMPQLWQAVANLANYYEINGTTEKAIATFEEALSAPYNAEGKTFIRNQLGRIYESARQYERAQSLYSGSLAIDPEQKDTFQHWFFLKQRNCDWPIALLPKPLTLEALAGSLGTLSSMAYFDDPELVNISCKEWIKRYKKNKTFYHLSTGENTYQHSKLRVGYVSCDFRMHAVSFLSMQMYELHDREQFEVYGFDYSTDDSSDVRQRIISGMDHFFPIHQLNDEESAKLIFENEIDILVDMVGLTSNGRPGIFMYKPAPIQISYLGFLGPVGFDEIDYLVCDQYVVPPKSAAHYGAKPLYLPFFQINNSFRQVIPPPSRSSQGLPEDAFVFCAILNSYKITQEVFVRWMSILKQTQHSVLWLLADNEALQKQFLNFAKLHGVDPSRIVFANPVHPTLYLARFQCADLFLDTSPYNAGITASDAIWMGLPVLTCPGNTYVSRMAADILLNLGLHDFVCQDWNSYMNKAIDFCDHKSAKQLFNQRFDKSNPIFDSANFVRQFEAALLKIQT